MAVENILSDSSHILTAFDEAPYPLVIYAVPAFKILFINEVACKILKKPKSEVLGKTYSEILPLAKARMEILETVYKSGEGSSQTEMELPIGIDEKGEHIFEYVNYHTRAVKNPEGEVIGVIAFGIMVTEQVLARRKLQQQDFRTTQILDHLPTGFFSLDENWQITYVNKAAEPALGLPRAECLGKNVWELHPHLIGSEFFHAYHKSMKERVLVEVTNYYPEQDRWYTTNSYPVDNGIAVSFTDITTRKKEEEARKLSDERFHTLTEAMPQMVWITNADGLTNYFNAQWMERTGTTLEENLGEGWTKVLHPEDRDKALVIWNNAMTSGSYDLEYRVRMADGTYRWHVARGVPTYGEDGKIKQWVGTTTDIHMQKQTQSDLQKALVARDEFLSIASHELKTPMSVIKLQAQLTRRNLDAGDHEAIIPKLGRYSDTTERNIQRLTRVVDDMLDISRVSTGKFNIEVEDVKINDLIEETLERMTPVFKESGCQLEWTPSENVHASWDKFRIEQVLINLLTNACRYGRGKPISLTAYTENDQIIIKVKDHGIGIASQDHQRIFERFERATTTADVAGLGLGLFIVKNIVDLHRGKITVNSKIGEGAEFIVALPVKPL